MNRKTNTLTRLIFTTVICSSIPDAVSPVIGIILMVAVTVAIVSGAAVVLVDISGNGDSSFSTAAVDITENKDGSKTVRVLRMAESNAVVVGNTQLNDTGETHTVTQSEAVIKTETKTGSQAVLRVVETSVSTKNFLSAPDGCTPLEETTGSGTRNNPHIITNIRQLQSINCDKSASYKLETNIDASYTSKWNNGSGFKPIAPDVSPGNTGYQGSAFTGNIRGNGNTVSNLHINRSGQNEVGMTGRLDGRINNISIKNAKISGAVNTGVLVGQNRGIVRDSQVTGQVNSNNRAVGGLAGRNTGTISTSHANTVIATGSRSTGGLVGRNGGTITDSYARGSVSGKRQVGGLVGAMFNGEVKRSYSSTVLNEGSVGGLVGFSFNSQVSNSYWDRITSKSSSSEGGKSLTTTEMQGKSARNNMTGFDFTRTWTVVTGPDDYPRFR